MHRKQTNKHSTEKPKECAKIIQSYCLFVNLVWDADRAWASLWYGKECLRGGIRRVLKGGEIIYCWAFFLICWTYAQSPAQAAHTSFTNNLLVIYFDPHTDRQNKKEENIKSHPRFDPSVNTKPFSILWVREKESLTGQQLKGHYSFIRQRINKNSAIYILKWKMCRK